MKEEIFRKCVRSLLENGMHLTNSNIELQSVLVKGGPITKSDAAKYMHKYVGEVIATTPRFSHDFLGRIATYLIFTGLIVPPKTIDTTPETELSELEIVNIIQELKH